MEDKKNHKTTLEFIRNHKSKLFKLIMTSFLNAVILCCCYLVYVILTFEKHFNLFFESNQHLSNILDITLIIMLLTIYTRYFYVKHKKILTKKIEKEFELKSEVLILTTILFNIINSVLYFCLMTKYKLIGILNMTIAVIYIIIVLVNIKKISKNEKNKNIEESNNNIINISNVLENNFKEASNKKGIFLEDLPILTEKEDLFKMNKFIKYFYEELIESNNSKQYVIGLVGEWGSGKTTIINLIKEYNKNKGNKIKIIDSIKLWKYDNKKAILRAFYRNLSKELNLDKVYEYELNNLFEKYLNVIFENGKMNIISKLFFSNKETDSEIFDKINDILNSQKKRIVVVLDDIDRLEPEEIQYVFSLLKSTLNFDKIVYLISYDEQVIFKTFESKLNVDPKYLEKIIQKKIMVPDMNKEVSNIASQAITNLFHFYNVKITPELNEEFLENISKKFKNIREIIIFISSVSFYFNIINELELCVEDYLIIQYIKIFYPNLYLRVYNNIDNIVTIYTEISYLNNSEDYSKSMKISFDTLFKDVDEKLMNLLAIVFPKINSYINNQEIRKYEYGNSSRMIKRYNRCCDKDSVYTYFSLSPTDYIVLNKIAGEIIEDINEKVDFKDKFCELEDGKIGALLTCLCHKIDDIREYSFLLSYLINDKIFKFETNPNGITKLVAEILDKMGSKECEKRINEIAENNLLLVDRIYKYYNYKSYSSRLSSILKSKCKLYMKTKSIFDENKPKMFMALLNKECELSIVKKYIKTIINEDNIIYFISFFVRDYGMNDYKLIFDDLNKYVNEKQIQDFLKEREYYKGTEHKKVYDLYTKKKLSISHFDWQKVRKEYLNTIHQNNKRITKVSKNS